MLLDDKIPVAMSNDSSQRNALLQALSYAWEFGYLVAVPLILFAVLGRFLDSKLHTKPWLFLAGILLSILISSVAVVRKALKIFKEASPPIEDTKAHNDSEHQE